MAKSSSLLSLPETLLVGFRTTLWRVFWTYVMHELLEAYRILTGPISRLLLPVHTVLLIVSSPESRHFCDASRLVNIDIREQQLPDHLVQCIPRNAFSTPRDDIPRGLITPRLNGTICMGCGDRGMFFYGNGIYPFPWRGNGIF